MAAHGGPKAVAEKMGWSLKGKSRKPKGYWDSMINVKQEIDGFIKEQGMKPGWFLFFLFLRLCAAL